MPLVGLALRAILGHRFLIDFGVANGVVNQPVSQGLAVHLDDFFVEDHIGWML